MALQFLDNRMRRIRVELDFAVFVRTVRPVPDPEVTVRRAEQAAVEPHASVPGHNGSVAISGWHTLRLRVPILLTLRLRLSSGFRILQPQRAWSANLMDRAGARRLRPPRTKR